MNKVLEIGAYVVASAVALGGGFLGAEALFGGEAPQAYPIAGAPDRRTEATPAKASAPPRNSAEFRSSNYGFSFRYPDTWRVQSLPHPKVIVAIARRDGAVCLVSVEAQKLPSDASGKPVNLSEMLDTVKPAHLTVSLPQADLKVASFEKSTLGGQDSRSFTMDAVAPPPLGKLKISGHATMRHFGAIVLMCLAPERLADATDFKNAFHMAQSTFRFE